MIRRLRSALLWARWLLSAGFAPSAVDWERLDRARAELQEAEE